MIAWSRNREAEAGNNKNDRWKKGGRGQVYEEGANACGECSAGEGSLKGRQHQQHTMRHLSTYQEQAQLWKWMRCWKARRDEDKNVLPSNYNHGAKNVTSPVDIWRWETQKYVRVQQVLTSCSSGCSGQKQEKVSISQRVGCFKDEPDRRDLPHQITSSDALGSVESCVNACAAKYFMWAI